MSEVILTKDNFDEEVYKCDKTVLVDFYATWCSPCSALAPVIEEISEEYSETVKVCKVNVEEQMELARKFKVLSIPMLVIFKNGEVSKTLVGLRPKEQIVAYL